MIGRPALLTNSGELITGRASSSEPNARVVSRNFSDSGLPWTLTLSPEVKEQGTAEFASRRRLIGTGLVAIVLLLRGSYVLWRVMARELAVARLQADFVAAVSHEFRTPLTSLQHMTELLEGDDPTLAGPDQDRRKTFYASLYRNTERLRRLVESLLDFSRMETGKKPWKMETLDAGILASSEIGRAHV